MDRPEYKHLSNVRNLSLLLVSAFLCVGHILRQPLPSLQTQWKELIFFPVTVGKNPAKVFYRLGGDPISIPEPIIMTKEMQRSDWPALCHSPAVRG